MTPALADLDLVVAVARDGGFRQAARRLGISASRVSEAVRRVEIRYGVRLFHRTTRSVKPTEAGRALLDRLGPALDEVTAAMDTVNAFRQTPTGLLRLNVPVSVARLVLPRLVPAFMAAYPDIRLEIMADSSIVDIIAAGCDAGIRYEEHLGPDMIALPIGPRWQRTAVAASSNYLRRRGMPRHPRDLLGHDCIRVKFSNGHIPAWEFEREGKTLTVDPPARLIVHVNGASELGIDTALAGGGVIRLFEDWLQPYFDSGALVPVLQPWWDGFGGPYLYYPGRRWLPAPLRAFVDFVAAYEWPAGNHRVGTPPA